LLDEHASVISGSTALRFFLPDESWDSEDLDIYVPDDMFNGVCDALETDPIYGCVRWEPRYDDGEITGTAEEGGLHHDATPDGAAPVHGLVGNYTVKELARFMTKGGRRVDVIRSFTHSAASPLGGFWSTLVTNFISPHMCASFWIDNTLSRTAILK
ncbi:hypothetical protein C8Q76DRAFT_578518, partial [Earliella scabrosa]